MGRSDCWLSPAFDLREAKAKPAAAVPTTSKYAGSATMTQAAPTSASWPAVVGVAETRGGFGVWVSSSFALCDVECPDSGAEHRQRQAGGCGRGRQQRAYHQLRRPGQGLRQGLDGALSRRGWGQTFCLRRPVPFCPPAPQAQRMQR